jgi:Kdo2-lipid A phosphotransferase
MNSSLVSALASKEFLHTMKGKTIYTWWHLKTLIFSVLLSFLLFGSWTWMPTRALWDKWDMHTFLFLNQTLQDHPVWQQIVGFFNLRKADLLIDLYMFLLPLTAVIFNKRERRKNIAKLLFMALCLYIVIVKVSPLFNRLSTFHTRESPSLVVEGALRLSQILNWPRLKDYSHTSFPADHALGFLVWAFLCLALFDKKVGLIALISALLFCLPRLIVGAHWLSDQLVGSLSLTLIFTATVLATPITPFILQLFDRLLFFGQKLINKAWQKAQI